MADLGKAYVQIVPSAEGIAGSIIRLIGGESASAGASAGQSIGASLVSTLKTVVVAAGIGKIIGDALTAGGDLQQSFGGIETLYGSAADSAKEMALAASEAGISANTYAEQAVSFGAALKQSFGDGADAERQAAEAADVAIKSMADNSAKMGTDIESIQNAYQGFAKSNYTMLDNLKLGFAGTKEGMQELLATASELSGKEYSIDNFADIVEAIDVVQQDLGIAGVAAEEASTTFTGSMQAMSAAWENTLAALTNPQNSDLGSALSALSTSVRNFVMGNFVPMMGSLFQQLPDLVGGAGGIITMLLGSITENASGIGDTVAELAAELATALADIAPSLATAAVSLVGAIAESLWNVDWSQVASNIINGITDSLNVYAAESWGASSAAQLVSSFATDIQTQLPTLLQQGVAFITNIVNGILQGLPQAITTAGEIVTSILDGILSNLPTVVSAGADLVTNLISGIASALPGIATAAVGVVDQLLTTLLDNAPALLEQGFNAVMQIQTGILNALPDIVTAAVEIITGLINTFIEHLPQLIELGFQMITNLATGLINNLPAIVTVAGQIVSAIWDTITGIDWLDLGVNVIQGIINGLLSMADALVSALLGMMKDAVGAIKEFFGINSPSKLFYEMGEYCVQGYVNSIDDNHKTVSSAMESLADTASSSLSVSGTVASGNETDNSDILARLDGVLTLMSKYYPELAENTANSNSISTINRALGMATI